jgi:hypothetical protein
MNIKNRRITVFAMTVLISLAGCSREVCSVGDMRITEKDIKLRAKVSEVFFPQNKSEHAALAQLIRGYVSLQIARSLGYETSQRAIEEEANRIDRDTKAPEILKKIKAVYGGDRKGYLNTFVTVVYAERLLYQESLLPTKSGRTIQYDEWFREKASMIPVRIHDQNLKAGFLKNISWANALKLE